MNPKIQQIYNILCSFDIFDVRKDLMGWVLSVGMGTLVIVLIEEKWGQL